VDDPLLSIGVFARRSRLSMKALRLYDRLGLLPPAEVDESSGYRRYRESQLATARLVVMLRRLDMPLAQVAEVVAAPDGRAAELVAAYWETVERRLAGQRELAAHVRGRLTGGEDAVAALDDVRERDVPEQLVLTEQRHVLAHELPPWIAAALGRLHAAAARFGGVAAPPFVVYRGEVSEDGDGPGEACVPIDHAESDEVAMRREPAHREAYVRLRKAQVEYPQILSAYSGLEQWIEARGMAAVDAPREVYFVADFAAAAPDDEVCDVAFPIG
jgi:DNA-binding transcriptional MerR regulator